MKAEVMEARPDYKEMYECAAKENEWLKGEIKQISEKFYVARDKNEVMQAQIAELERERQYHLGQIDAYRFALKGGEE